MNISRLATTLGVSAFFVPALASAQAGINLSAITPYSNGIINVINQILVPVLMAIAFIVFLWGVYTYFIAGAADAGERETGRQFVLWGVIGFVVIISLWGLVNLTQSVLGLSAGNTPAVPTFGASQTGGTSAQTFPGAGNAQVGGGGVSTGAYTRTVYSPSGAVLGTVNAGNQILNQAGRLVGSIIRGRVVDTAGAPISGASVTATGAGISCSGDSYGSCPSGYACDGPTEGRYECVADTTASNSCVSTGCSDGEFCNTSTGACESSVVSAPAPQGETTCPDGQPPQDDGSCP